jgi:hypothetical protein
MTLRSPDEDMREKAFIAQKLEFMTDDDLRMLFTFLEIKKFSTEEDIDDIVSKWNNKTPIELRDIVSNITKGNFQDETCRLWDKASADKISDSIYVIRQSKQHNR